MGESVAFLVQPLGAPGTPGGNLEPRRTPGNTRGPRGSNFIKIRVFGGFEGSGGAGAITNRRGMKKYPGGLIFVKFDWSSEGFMPNLKF